MPHTYIYMPQLQIMKEISITTELMAVGLYSHTLWCARGVCVSARWNYCYFCAAQSAPERAREKTLWGARGGTNFPF
jgi:hypothetical protein